MSLGLIRRLSEWEMAWLFAESSYIPMALLIVIAVGLRVCGNW